MHKASMVRREGGYRASAASTTGPEPCALIVATIRGRIRVATDGARRWMESHFTEWTAQRAYLPPELQQLIHRHRRRGSISHRRIITCHGTMFTITVVLVEGLVLLVPQRASDAGQLPRLTSRQTEILSWVAEGKQNDEIAKILLISPRTVQHHLERVYEKLGVDNRTAAARTLLTVWQQAKAI